MRLRLRLWVILLRILGKGYLLVNLVYDIVLHDPLSLQSLKLLLLLQFSEQFIVELRSADYLLFEAALKQLFLLMLLL